MSETSEKTVVSKRKGSKTSEQIIGQGASRVSAAVALLVKASNEFAVLPKTIEELSLQIADKEQTLNELSVQYQEKKRQSQVQLDLDYKADRLAFVAKYAEENASLLIKEEVYDSLVDENANLKANLEAEVSKEVAKQVAITKHRFESDMKVKEFEFNAKEAENKATINSLQAQLQAAKAEAANYVQQLNLERTASIERAKASSVGHINIGTPTNSR